MRFILTFVVINLFAATVSDTDAVKTSLTLSNSSTLHTSYRDNLTEEDDYLMNAAQLKDKLPVDNHLISIKISNKQSEVIAKWQGKSSKVVIESTNFLEKASAGIYRVNSILEDGTEFKHILKK